MRGKTVRNLKCVDKGTTEIIHPGSCTSSRCPLEDDTVRLKFLSVQIPADPNPLHSD